jgi:hypothetical protein
VVLHGSGTTGCHHAVERGGRAGWAYDLGYLLRHGADLDALRADPDRTRLVWFHHDRVWKELFSSGVAVTRPELAAPPADVLALVDAAITGQPW